MSRILQVFYIFFSSIAIAMSIPNDILKFGSPLIALFSLVPFYISFTQNKKCISFVLSFGLLTFITHLLSSYWLAFFKDFAIFTLGASALGTAAIGCGFGFLLSIPYTKRKQSICLIEEKSIQSSIFIIFRIFWFASIYVLYEWFKSTGFLGYPWGTLSMAFFEWNTFIQIADITGTYGITFACAFFSATAAETILFFNKNGIKQKQGCAHQIFALTNAWIFIGIIITSFLIYGTWIKIFSPKPIKIINTIMVQQNSDPWKNISDSETILLSQQLTDKAFEESEQMKEKVDLVVWSEGCLKSRLPTFISHYEYTPSSSPLLPYIRKKAVPFLLGSPFSRNFSNGDTMNGACIIDEKGEFRGAYPKNHLVPFAESLPFSEIPFVKNFLMKSIGISAGWKPGDQYTLFNIKARYPKNFIPEEKIYDLSKSIDEQKFEDENSFVKISTPICYDDAFPDICRPLVQTGSEIFMNITDDSWSKKESSEYQHFVVSAYRAIEYRTTLARSTNSGYSVVLDPTGKIIKDMPLFKEDSIFVKIPVYERKETIYLIFGNWFPKTLALINLLFGFLKIFSKTKNQIFENSERKKLSKIQKKQCSFSYKN